MKKIIRFLIFVLVLIVATPCFFTSNLSASAATLNNSAVSATEFETTVNAIVNEYAAFTNRIAGSDGEKNASEYIRTYLNSNTALVAKDDIYVKSGIQKFTYESDMSGTIETSQNIIYTHEASKKTARKVIIGCHYDAVAFNMDITSENYGDYIDSESINGSAGSVALLLTLAKYLPAYSEFNVEFVFFGAGEDSKAGSSYYTKGISEDDKNNIVCMINVNQIAVGKKVYFYMNEVETKTSAYVEDLTYNSRVDVEKINTVHLNKIIPYTANELGLDYSHVALDSDNINFMKEGIETINIFAGDYSEGVVIGRQEFAGKELSTYTVNDSRQYILTAYPDYSISNNLYNAFKAINCVLNDSAFVATFDEGKGETSWFYKIFTNQNLVLYLTIVVFVVFIVVAMYVYYKLSIRAYHANIEMEFLSSVVKISDHIDASGKDENVAKVVSQVIATDIKKDKVIKVKPPKDDKKDDNENK